MLKLAKNFTNKKLPENLQKALDDLYIKNSGKFNQDELKYVSENAKQKAAQAKVEAEAKRKEQQKLKEEEEENRKQATREKEKQEAEAQQAKIKAENDAKEREKATRAQAKPQQDQDQKNAKNTEAQAKPKKSESFSPETINELKEKWKQRYQDQSDIALAFDSINTAIDNAFALGFEGDLTNKDQWTKFYKTHVLLWHPDKINSISNITDEEKNNLYKKMQTLTTTNTTLQAIYDKIESK